MTTAAGDFSADQLRQHLGLRGDQVAVDLVGLGDVDLRRAVLGQRVLHAGGGAGGADDDRRRLAERAGGGERLQGGLADAAAGRVELDQDQNLCHGDVSSSFDPGRVRRSSGRRGSSTNFSRAVALVGDLHALALAAGGRRSRRTAAGGVRQARPRRRRRPGRPATMVSHRLLLRRHDPLERGVARLVDGVPGRTRSPAAAPRRPSSRRRSAARSVASPPSTVSLRAPVSCGMPSRSASSAGITSPGRRWTPRRRGSGRTRAAQRGGEHRRGLHARTSRAAPRRRRARPCPRPSTAPCGSRRWPSRGRRSGR